MPNVWIFCFLLSAFLLLTPGNGSGQPLLQREKQAYARLQHVPCPEKVEILTQLAEYITIDSTERAKVLILQAINVSRECRDDKSLANAFLAMGKVMLYQGKLDSAYSCLYHAGLLKKSQNDLSKMDQVYFNLGVYRQKKTKYKEALENYRLALKFSGIFRNYPLAGRCYTEMANCYRNLNKTQDMAGCLDKAEEMLMKGGDSLKLANAYGHLGVLYSDIGRGEKCTRAYFRAIYFAELMGDNLNMGYVYCNLSGAFGSSEKALEYDRKALEIFRKTGNRKGMAYALNNIGQIYFFNKQPAKAISYFLEGGRLKIAVADWQGASFLYNNIGEVYVRQKKFSLAKQFLDLAEQLAEKSGDNLSKLVVLNTRGLYHSFRKEHKEARDFYSASLELASESKMVGFVASNLTAISNEYQAEGKHEEALAFYKKYTATHDSILEGENLKNVAEMRVKYEADKKDSRIRELSELTKHGSPRNRVIFYGNIGIGILLVISAIFFLFRINRKVRLANENMAPVNSEVYIHSYRSHRIDQATKQVLSPDQQQTLWAELNRLMSDEKLYLNSNLKLSELAGRLNTNTSYLSKVINDESKENFCNYLNQLRIKEAQNLLSDPDNQHLSIEGIAQTVGFNSKSAFNTSFKKYTLKTPSEFISDSLVKEKSIS